jgi:hypothetical protein
MKLRAPRISAFIKFIIRLASVAGWTRGIGKTPLQLELFSTDELPDTHERKTLRRENGFYL